MSLELGPSFKTSVARGSCFECGLFIWKIGAIILFNTNMAEKDAYGAQVLFSMM